MPPRGFRERWLVFGLGLALALLTLAPAALAAPATTRTPRSPTVYHKSRSFRIPFNVDPADRSRLSEVQLWVSEDSGYTWKAKSRTTPDHPHFTFRAARDGEYWFAVRTVDKAGRLYPGEDDQVEPSMKVIVDTNPPSLLLEPDGRRGTLAAVRWEVRDEHLDLKSFTVEYQAEGAREWRQVPIRRPALIGSENWDAGTAGPLKVRANVEDKAGNLTEAVINLPEGSASNPALGAQDTPIFSSPPVSRISSGPGFSPVDEASRGGERPAPFSPRAPGANENPTFPAPGQELDPFGGSGAAAGSALPSNPGGVPAGGGVRTLLVPSPKFALQYAVDDAGPNGPASVELWVTQDGGRTWIRRGEDPDRVSPFQVDLGGEGTFGLCLVARSASGLGDQPPAPGDPPQLWVEVDSTAPSVQLDPPFVGTGVNVGKVAIQWRATDLHLAPRPVVLYWRAELEGARWQPITEPIENTGKYIWTVPPNIPPRFHIRVEVVDTMGNKGATDTTAMGPVMVDRTRPRSRIIGLDPSARGGNGPGARPLR